MNEVATESKYIILSADVQRLLSENNVGLNDILAQAALGPNEVREVFDPATPELGAKEVVTIILASAAAVAVLTPLLTKVVRLYTHRPIVVEDTELVPTYDKQGKPLIHPSGDPVLHWQRKKRLLEPQQNNQQSKATIKGFGIEIKVE
jgi:hypothetical protein